MTENSNLQKLAQKIREINNKNGWDAVTMESWLGVEEHRFFIPAKLALVTAEVSEALEAYRKGDLPHFLEELADVVIRTLDIAVGLTDNFDKVVNDKIEFNARRGYRHGGKRV